MPSLRKTESGYNEYWDEKSMKRDEKSITKSSRPEVFCKKGVLKIFTKFTEKHLGEDLFFNKGLRPATLLKKRLWHKCFPVNFVKFLRPLFLENTYGGCFCFTENDFFWKTLKPILCRKRTSNEKATLMIKR